MQSEEKVELLFCEFGPDRGTHGGVTFSGGRLDPSLSSFKRYFPNSSVRVITDTPDNYREYSSLSNFSVEVVQPQIDKGDKRWGYRCSDLYRAIGMLESKSDICIYLDTDLFVCNDRVHQAVSMAKIFGFCAPANPRITLKKDATDGNDLPPPGSRARELVLEHGMMFSFNCAPLFFSCSNSRARDFLQKWVSNSSQYSVRGPVAVNAAALETGYFPCLLPFQWCVSREDVQDEVVLHLGKAQIAQKYFGNG
jgi:hypothetical protein